MEANIKTPSDFGKSLKHPYAWPGGYPTYYVTSDGAALCVECARKEGSRITASIRDHCNDGWQVCHHDVNWEDCSLLCDHCGEQIESAYGDE